MPGKPKSGSDSTVMGVAWYRPEQWQRLREVSIDVAELEDTYAEWLENANRTAEDLLRSGVRVVKIDFDIEEFLAWCRKTGSPLAGDARAAFTMEKTRDMFEKKRHLM